MSKKKIVEYRCKNCNTLLLRGLVNRDGRNVSLENIKPRKNALIKNLSFTARECFGDEYMPEESVLCNFSMDVVCACCGRNHEDIMHERLYVTYKTYDEWYD